MASYGTINVYKNEAEEKYAALLRTIIKHDSVEAKLLMEGDDEAHSGLLRGALVDRQGPASWEEVVHSRLIWDLVNCQREDYDADGSIAPFRGHEEQYFRSSLTSLLDSFPNKKIKTSFHKSGGKIPKGLLKASPCYRIKVL